MEEKLKEYINKEQFKIKEPIEYFIFEKKNIILILILLYLQFYMFGSLFLTLIKIGIFIYIVKSFKNNYTFLTDIKRGAYHNYFARIYVFFMKKIFKGN